MKHIYYTSNRSWSTTVRLVHSWVGTRKSPTAVKRRRRWETEMVPKWSRNGHRNSEGKSSMVITDLFSNGSLEKILDHGEFRFVFWWLFRVSGTVWGISEEGHYCHVSNQENGKKFVRGNQFHPNKPRNKLKVEGGIVGGEGLVMNCAELVLAPTPDADRQSSLSNVLLSPGCSCEHLMKI